jgi:hypothetical protein
MKLLGYPETILLCLDDSLVMYVELPDMHPLTHTLHGIDSLEGKTL